MDVKFAPCWRLGNSANVMAAYYHDHIVVPADKADAALGAFATIQSKRSSTSPSQPPT